MKQFNKKSNDQVSVGKFLHVQYNTVCCPKHVDPPTSPGLVSDDVLLLSEDFIVIAECVSHMYQGWFNVVSNDQKKPISVSEDLMCILEPQVHDTVSVADRSIWTLLKLSVCLIRT